jgi:PleD family two-component response regulator
MSWKVSASDERMKSQTLQEDKSQERTILLADDHRVVRQGLRAVLEANSSFRVIGEAGEGLEATRLAERLRPDVLVLDLMMPGLNGLEAIALPFYFSPLPRGRLRGGVEV